MRGGNNPGNTVTISEKLHFHDYPSLPHFCVTYITELGGFVVCPIRRLSSPRPVLFTLTPCIGLSDPTEPQIQSLGSLNAYALWAQQRATSYVFAPFS